MTPQPYRCPTCNGHGTTSKPPWVAGDQETWGANSTKLYPCPACNATGVVWSPAITPEEEDVRTPAEMRLYGQPSDENDNYLTPEEEGS